MRKHYFLCVLIVLMALAPALRAQGFWEKKPYKDWSQNDCRKLLKDSPWANGYTVGRVVMETVRQESAVAGREEEPLINYGAQLWSAKPIRQAIVRLSQLDPKYAQLSPDQKKALDEKQAKFIETEFPDSVIVQVVYSTTAQAYDRQLAQYWQNQSEDILRTNSNLIGSQGRVAPVHVVVAPGAGREIQFIFPRNFNGKPMIGPDDKELSLELAHPQIGIVRGERVFIRFSVKKMIVDGKVVY